MDDVPRDPSVDHMVHDPTSGTEEFVYYCGDYATLPDVNQQAIRVMDDN